MRITIPSFSSLRPVLLAGFLLALLFAVFPPRSGAEEILRIGVEDDYAPFSFPAEGTQAGFDPEIAEALCKAMRRSCTVEPLAFGTLLEKMRRGELDMIVAGLAKNEQRLAYMDFTNSYYHSRSIYLGLPGSVAVSAEGLKGKRVGVQDHTQQEIFLRSHWVNVAEIIRFSTYGQLIDAFCAGQLDAILVDGLSGYEFLQSERGQPFAILDDPLPPDEDLAYAHIGVRKNNSELIEAINEAIVHIKLNGEYDRIVRKYFPFSIY
ncbi:substrate-binding periplasmic protein [Bilophila wadsworthia]|uniref:substrate-binding periplasmic protein n=1 Tax=Bilophila wadsworthia TaxID=35833 RepID=UPI00242DD734|nr:transporter substrate-binding domain-containing protein [Bilophila wadsworthia]